MLNVNELIKREESVLKKLVGEKNKIILELDDSIPELLINSTLFDQILFNLLTNARDAIVDKGSITIQTKMHAHKTLGAIFVLSVSDTGEGMIDEVKNHLFEPFFTTKKGGHGIGLYTIKKIIQDNNGEIKIQSKANHGTIFKIFFKELV